MTIPIQRVAVAPVSMNPVNYKHRYQVIPIGARRVSVATTSANQPIYWDLPNTTHGDMVSTFYKYTQMFVCTPHSIHN